MPRYFFHLSAPDETFHDRVGSETDDLVAAHATALRLAKRVMAYSMFADYAGDFRGWAVKIVDEAHQPVMSVLFPAKRGRGRHKAISTNNARSLLLTVEHSQKLTASGRILPRSTPFKSGLAD